MNQKIMEIIFKVYKDGKDINHQVGFIYIIQEGFKYINNKKEKLDQSMAWYPESKGYKLVFDHEKSM